MTLVGAKSAFEIPRNDFILVGAKSAFEIPRSGFITGVNECSVFEITRGSLSRITTEGGLLRIQTNHPPHNINITVPLLPLDPMFIENNSPEASSEVRERIHTVEMELKCSEGTVKKIIYVMMLKLKMHNQLVSNDKLLQAAKAGRTEEIIGIFGSGSVFDEILGPAIGLAAESGRTETVSALLARGPISDEHCGLAVVSAASNGHIEIAELLLANGSISNDVRGPLFCRAAEKGYTKIVAALLKNGEISRQDYNFAMGMAAEAGHTEILINLLQSRSIPQNDCFIFLRRTIQNGRTETVRDLLSANIFPLSDDDRGFLVVVAAKRGFLEILKILLSKGSIPETRRHAAIAQATKKDYREIIVALRPNKTTGEARELSLTEAVPVRPTEIIASRREPSEYEIRGQSVCSAAREGNLKTLESLLNRGEISDADRGQAVRVAAEKGYTEIVKALFNSGAISEDDRDYVAFIATKNGYTEILKKSFVFSANDQDSYYLALEVAAIEGHVEMIRYLLSLNIFIFDDKLGFLVVLAAKRGFLEIVKNLLAKGSIPETRWHAALDEATQKNYKEIIEALHVNRTTGEARELSVTEASLAAQVGIEDCLRSFFFGRH